MGIVSAIRAFFDGAIGDSLAPKLPVRNAPKFIDAVGALRRIEARHFIVGTSADLPVERVKLLLKDIPQSSALEFLGRMPVNADDGPCTLEFGIEYAIAERNERLMKLRDLYLAHFKPYFDSMPVPECEQVLQAMQSRWTPPVVVDGITDYAAKWRAQRRSGAA